MLLKLRKKNMELVEVEDLSDRLRVIDQKNEFFQLSLRALLQFIKDFSLDIKEIESAAIIALPSLPAVFISAATCISVAGDWMRFIS